jgi:type I restriction enzyme S subunit
MSQSNSHSLDDACEFIVDCLHKTAPFEDKGFPMIRTPNIGKGRLILDGVFRVSEETYQTWTQRAVPLPGDLILAREAPAGNVALITEGENVCLGQRTVHLRPKSGIVDGGYLCNLLLTPEYQGKLLAGETGATAKHVNLKDIRRLQLENLPRVEVQRRIADILSAYDDLIEINRRRMVLLEESARHLYQEWFVRLRFPGYEHTRIINGVPEGWERKRLDAVAEVNRESLGGSFNGEIDYIDISAVTPGQIENATHYQFADAPSRARRVVQHGDIIWSCVRPNRKSHSVIWRPQPNLIASTGFAVITPVSVPTAFLLFATTTPDFVGYLENHAKGAAYPAVVAGDFERASIRVPRAPLLRAFKDFAEPLFDQSHNLKQQNQKLRVARDLLLPRLMSGEVAV